MGGGNHVSSSTVSISPLYLSFFHYQIGKYLLPTLLRGTMSCKLALTGSRTTVRLVTGLMINSSKMLPSSILDPVSLVVFKRGLASHSSGDSLSCN